jgi:hypothetical protein
MVMGGCGGKKAREKRKAGTSTVGGKFDSIGQVEEQQANHALVVRLLAEIIPLVHHASSNDRLFLQDVRIKLNQQGSNAQFGWRQVEAMVRVHAEVLDKEAHSGKRN